MANIDLKELFRQKQGEFRTRGSGDRNFELDFVAAVNMATSAISVGANLATTITLVTKPEGTVGLDALYQDIFSQMVTVRLVTLGQKARNEDPDVVLMRRNEPENIDMIRQSILNIAVTADTDNESDFAALGAGTGSVDTGGTNA